MSVAAMEAPGKTAHRLLIGGEYVAGEGAEITVLNPATEEVVARFAGASSRQIDATIAAARRAYDAGDWALASREHRAQVVRRFLDELGARRAALKEIVISETGTPAHAPIMFIQVDSPIVATRDLIDLYLTLPETEDCGQPLSERINPFGSLVLSLRRHVPLGVVTAISAYNFPLYLNLWKVIPALVTGNTVILRPSPLTPLSALAMAEAAQAAGFPPGVFNIVAEAGAEGGVQLTTDPRVDMVTFTGSNHVGGQVMKQAADGLKRIQLELGGKSAAIYLPDSVERAGMAAHTVCLAHAGQGCVLGTRVMVPQEHKAEIMAKMKAGLEQVVIGDPLDPTTQMGPVVSAGQRERCERYVQLAVDAGAKVVTGGKRPAHLKQGYFFEPTVLDTPDNGNPAAQDEIFGPVVSVIGYTCVDHAIEMANDSTFGLSGYVFGKDLKAAAEVAKRMRTGTVNVNSGAMSAYVSSGGWGRSGFGRERGAEGLRIYQQTQMLNLANQ
ncbi:MAG: aldehyde dehydrogenase [Caulobacteraceae bacterium]|nr:aldehyde dehydrogenase [Caulobacteraceae bacterium]